VATSLKPVSSPLKGASSGKRVATASPPEQNLKQRTKTVANKLVKKALAFSSPLEVGGMEDATLQTLLSGGVVEAHLLSELKNNNHFSSEEMCVRVLGCLFVDHRSDRPMNQRDVAMRQVSKEPNVLFKNSSEKIEPFTLANAFEGDPDHTKFVASLYTSDQQSSTMDENSDEFVLFMEVMEHIISMCVAATISSAEQGMRSNARALVKGNQLLMARLGDCREVASKGGSSVAASKFTSEQYAILGYQASLHVYINPNTLALDATAVALYLRGARALLPTEVPKPDIGVIVAKEGVDGIRNVEEQNGFYVDRLSCVYKEQICIRRARKTNFQALRIVCQNPQRLTRPLRLLAELLLQYSSSGVHNKNMLP